MVEVAKEMSPEVEEGRLKEGVEERLKEEAEGRSEAKEEV